MVYLPKRRVAGNFGNTPATRREGAGAPAGALWTAACAFPDGFRTRWPTARATAAKQGDIKF